GERDLDVVPGGRAAHAVGRDDEVADGLGRLEVAVDGHAYTVVGLHVLVDDHLRRALPRIAVRPHRDPDGATLTLRERGPPDAVLVVSEEPGRLPLDVRDPERRVPGARDRDLGTGDRFSALARRLRAAVDSRRVDVDGRDRVRVVGGRVGRLRIE